MDLTRCYIIKSQSPDQEQKRQMYSRTRSLLWTHPASQQGLDVHTKQPEKELSDNPTNSMRYHQGVQSFQLQEGGACKTHIPECPKRITDSSSTTPLPSHRCVSSGGIQSSLEQKVERLGSLKLESRRYRFHKSLTLLPHLRAFSLDLTQLNKQIWQALREKLKKHLKLLPLLPITLESPRVGKKGVKFSCKKNYQILGAVGEDPRGKTKSWGLLLGGQHHLS